MKPSSSNWEKAIHMDDTICGAKWECYSGEWPPVMAICMGCGVIFRLIAHDHQSDELSFRRLT